MFAVILAVCGDMCQVFSCSQQKEIRLYTVGRGPVPRRGNCLKQDLQDLQDLQD